MGRCISCGRQSEYISQTLSLCARCIREEEGLREHAARVHLELRREFGLPGSPPRKPGGRSCKVCANECSFGEADMGYCGIRYTEDGSLKGATLGDGRVSWYFDDLPTNCVADWVCAGGSHSGYPAYSHSPGPEKGYRNLAVFYYGCSFDCLFCQNWQQKRLPPLPGKSPRAIADCLDESTSCICFFGGDPTPQLPHALAVCRRALENKPNVLRICWETNGSMNGALLDEMVDLSLETGGCIKFDLKTWDDNLSWALCGRSNERTFANFEKVASLTSLRSDPPLLVASTLLVPGYVEEEEVHSIASFIAGLDRGIPYCLLAFRPEHAMSDLPGTSRSLAEGCLRAARDAGLSRIKIGNPHLLV